MDYKRNIVALALCVALGAFATHAQPSTTTQEEAEAELTAIQKMMRALSSRLGYARSKRDTAEEKLRAAELAIGRAATQSRKIDNGLEEQQRQLEALRRQRDEKTKALVMQRDDLARRIRLSYAMGHRDYLKIFLNQENPSTLARILTYYRYFNQARAEQIEATRLQLEQINVLEEGIDRKTLHLQELKHTKKKAREKLKRLFEQRKTVLTGLTREISQGNQRLARLKQNKDRLEKLITDIQQSSKSRGYHRAFRNLRGNLEWPTVGVIMNDFGAKRGLEEMQWQGVKIAAKAGRPVRAIAIGEVVFADWLRGFGLLLIIDHGDGYMSLYGHNQSLHKQSGELVQPGEVIASVGNSGGNVEEGLYFEIRHQGYPQNPALWCR
ncbi:MAG: peptidoglycan DD-metalloendopeptidase family protein [Gammaproteobacteria bacterium]|nr:peptidoglycan DD-metalloendopeptidase family protein [Gammaproteobacteria bacterium]NNJ83907.1 peptidoglycan DD-metalloendopeptidase family protein [Gammaproteobacteria bacterium]